MPIIAVLGGSGAATPEFTASLREGGVGGIELRLVGRDAAKLAEVASAAAGLAGHDIRVTTATDPGAGVSGADIVVNQVRVGGLRARAFDETFPRELGIPGEETLGAGGFANAFRTIPVVLELARLVERESPAAWFINLTNPAGIVHQAVERTTALKVITVCDSPVTLVEQVRVAIGDGNAEVDHIGLNHAGFVTAARVRGADVLQRAADQYAGPVDPAFVRGLGVIPNPYLRYYLDPPGMLSAQQGKRARAEELLDLEAELLAAYRERSDSSARPEPLARRGAAWYGKATVPVVRALLGGGGDELVVGMRNGDTVPWLPSEAAVELPTWVGASGAGPRRVGALPPDATALLQAHAAFETLTAEGILEHSEAKLVRALIANPMVPGLAAARAVLERVRASNPT